MRMAAKLLSKNFFMLVVIEGVVEVVAKIYAISSMFTVFLAIAITIITMAMTIIKLMVTIIRTNFINRICKVVDSRLTGLQNIFQSSKNQKKLCSFLKQITKKG